MRTIGILVCVGLALGGCWTGKILVDESRLEARPLPAFPARVGVEGVPRVRSGKYQGTLEKSLVRLAREGGLFGSVSYRSFDPDEVDLVLRVEPAIVAYDIRANAAYFPLALATLTLYIWVGGPIHTHTEFYDVTVAVHDPRGGHLFDVSTRERHTHWVSLYSREYGDAICRGPHADEVLVGLLEDLGERLRNEGPPRLRRTAAGAGLR